HGHVHGDRDAEFPREDPLGADHVVHTEAGTASGQGHGEQSAVRGEVGVPDPPYVVGGDRDLAFEPVVGERGVGAAVRVLGPDAGLLQRPDGRVRVLRRVVDVGPVHQCGDTGVDALQRAGEVGGVDILRPVHRGEGVEDLYEVVVQGGVRGHPLDGRLPGVPVNVEESGDHDEPGRVDNLGVGVDLGLNGGDQVVLNEHVPGVEFADLRVH